MTHIIDTNQDPEPFYVIRKAAIENFYSGHEFEFSNGYYRENDELMDGVDELLDRVAYENWVQEELEPSSWSNNLDYIIPQKPGRVDE